MPVDPEEEEHERRASAEEDEFERKLRLGQHKELFPDLLHAVEAEPLRERRALQLMLAMYRCGRQNRALREFVRFRTALGEEVGLEPSVEATELSMAIHLEPPELDWRHPNAVSY